MSPVEIQDLRRRLQQRREELRRRVTRVDADLRRESDPLVGDFADRAVQRANDAVLDAIGMSAEDELRQIDGALTRINEGCYEVCAKCGNGIAPERLKVVPYTDLCASCASALRSVTPR
jgi:RNA polymerase-binding transcription factor DksA